MTNEEKKAFLLERLEFIKKEIAENDWVPAFEIDRKFDFGDFRGQLKVVYAQEETE